MGRHREKKKGADKEGGTPKFRVCEGRSMVAYIYIYMSSGLGSTYLLVFLLPVCFLCLSLRDAVESGVSA